MGKSKEAGMKRFIQILLVVQFVISYPVFAGILDATVVVSGTTVTDSFTSVDNLVDTLTDSYLATHFPTYSNTSKADATLNFRGIDILASYPLNGNTLRFQIPKTGLDISFTGATRDESQSKLKDWFKTSGGAELTKLMKAFAANTANDPIAGNPNSLQANIVATDFIDGTGMGSTTTASDVGKGGSKENLIGIGVSYTTLDQGGLDSKRVTVPIKYAIVSDANPRRVYTFKLPITQVDVDGAKSYQVGLGFSAALPVTGRWTLTPTFTYGLGGSIDLGSAAQMASGSLTSRYDFKLSKYMFTLGNMIGYYKTIPLKYGDFDIDPDIANTAFRNGLMMTIPFGSEAKGRHVQLFAIDTRYTGTELFINQYNDLGFAIGFTRNLRLGLTYITSDESKGYSVNFGYKF